MRNANTVIGLPRLFLSYSRKDMDFALALHDELKAANYEVLIDRSDIAAGEEWQARLAQLIKDADTVVFCLSPHSASSKVCAWEADEAERLGKRILPIVAQRVADADVPPPIAKFNFIFFDGKPRDEALGQLKSALETDLPWLRQHTRLGDLALQWNAKPGNAGVLRSKALEEAELWIASQPRNAALATELQRDFIAASRKAASSRQRNWISGAAAVVLLSLGLAGWSEINRREAVKQTAIAETQTKVAEEQKAQAIEERDRADKTLTVVTKTVTSLVIDLALQESKVPGVPKEAITSTLDASIHLIQSLADSGQSSPELKRVLASAFGQSALALLDLGKNEKAIETAGKALKIDLELLLEDSTNAPLMTAVAADLDLVGKSQEANGNSKEALLNYNFELEVRQRLANQNSIDEKLQRDLFVIYQKIGRLEKSQKNFEVALVQYKSSLVIAEKLAAQDPKNLKWQRDVSISYDNVGSILEAQGDLSGALKSYQASLAIVENLVAQDPGNATWQRDFLIGYKDIGDILLEQENKVGAVINYQAGLAIAENLAASDTENPERQRDLVVGYWKLAHAGSDPRVNYQRALTKLNEMKAKGILAASDEKLIALMERQIAELK